MKVFLKYNDKFVMYGNNLVTSNSFSTYGLLSRYRFENNLNDAQGNYNLTSSATPNYTTGKVGQCVNDDIYYYSTDATYMDYFLGTSPWTISFWMKITPGTNNIKIFHCGDGNQTHPQSTVLMFSHVFIIGSIYTDTMYIARANTTTSHICYTTSLTDQGPFVNQTWDHYVVTFDGTNVCTYYNTILKGSSSNAGVITSGATSIGINGYGVNPADIQKYDQFYIYNRALDYNEVRLLYNDGIGI